MLMGDFFPIQILESRLEDVREQQAYLERLQQLEELEAETGKSAIEQEKERLQSEEAKLLAEIQEEEKVLEKTYQGYEIEQP